MGGSQTSLKRIFMGVILGGALSIVLLVAINDYLAMTCKKHLSRAEFNYMDIPLSAEDISIGIPGLLDPITVVEFTCPEQDFLEWAKKRGHRLETMPHQFSVCGYDYCCSGDLVPKMTTIQKGYRYRKQHSENRSFEVAYDQVTRRAYYKRSTR